MADKDTKSAKDEAPAASAAAKTAKPRKKHDPLNEAGWSAFGAVLLAGFGMIVIAMGGASFFEAGLATALTLLGGLGIFGLSAMFAKIAVTEFGQVVADSVRANAPKEPPTE